jgi:hypothetical protein
MNCPNEQNKKSWKKQHWFNGVAITQNKAKQVQEKTIKKHNMKLNNTKKTWIKNSCEAYLISKSSWQHVALM